MLCGTEAPWTTFFSWANRTTSAICRIRSSRVPTLRHSPCCEQEMIEPDRQGVVLEDEGRAEFVLGEAVDAQDAGVLERLEELELPQGRPLELFPVLPG